MIVSFTSSFSTGCNGATTGWHWYLHYSRSDRIASENMSEEFACRLFFLAEFFDWWVSWVFHSTASHAAHIDVNAALGRSAMAATTARCECWLCRRRRLCQNGLTFWWVETQKIVVVVVAKVMVGKTLWFRGFFSMFATRLVYYNLLMYIYIYQLW